MMKKIILLACVGLSLVTPTATPREASVCAAPAVRQAR